MQELFNIQKSIHIIHHINRFKYKSYIIITIDAEKIFDRIQHLFVLKTPKKLEIFLNIINITYAKTKVTIILNKKNKIKVFLIETGTRQGCTFFTTSIQHSL